MSGGLKNSSYARTAHALLVHIVHLQGYPVGLDTSQALEPDHPLVTHLSCRRNHTLNMVAHVIQDTSLADMNTLRPLAEMNDNGDRLPAQPAWSADSMNMVATCISAYFECKIRQNSAHRSRTDQQLLVI